MAVFCMFYVGLFEVYSVHFFLCLLSLAKCTGTGVFVDVITTPNPHLPDHLNQILHVYFVVFNRKCDDVPLTNLT